MICFSNSFFLCFSTDGASICLFSCLSTSSGFSNLTSIPCMFFCHRNLCSSFYEFAAIITIFVTGITSFFASCFFVIFQDNISMIISICASNFDCFISTHFITVITLNIMCCGRCAGSFLFYFSRILICKGMSIWLTYFFCIFCYLSAGITKEIILGWSCTSCFLSNLIKYFVTCLMSGCRNLFSFFDQCSTLVTYGITCISRLCTSSIFLINNDCI